VNIARGYAEAHQPRPFGEYPGPGRLRPWPFRNDKKNRRIPPFRPSPSARRPVMASTVPPAEVMAPCPRVNEGLLAVPPPHAALFPCLLFPGLPSQAGPWCARPAGDIVPASPGSVSRNAAVAPPCTNFRSATGSAVRRGRTGRWHPPSETPPPGLIATEESTRAKEKKFSSPGRQRGE